MTTNEIANKYLKDEQILWQGEPKNVPIFHKSDIFILPFTILFGGFLIAYAVISAIMMIAGQGIWFSLVGITFLLMGIYILFLRLWYRKKRIKRQRYFVTNKRVFAFDTLRDDVLFDIPLNETDLYLGHKSLILTDVTNATGDFVYNLGLDIFFRKFAHETPAFKYINDEIQAVSKIIVTNSKKVVETDNDELFI